MICALCDDGLPGSTYSQSVGPAGAVGLAFVGPVSDFAG